eukprot:scaffold1310_cov24-Cyclotella_meneghiniana.AAC.2
MWREDWQSCRENQRLDVGSPSGEGVDFMLPGYEQSKRVGSSGVRRGETLSRGTGGVDRATPNPRSGVRDDKPGSDKEDGGYKEGTVLFVE